MAPTMYSVFIPRVFINFTKDRIIETFKKLDIGLVNDDGVQLIRKTSKDGTYYWMAFIHFDYLYETENGRQFKEDVEDETKQAKLVYEDPWYWLVLPFRKKETPSDAQAPTSQETQSNQTYLHYGPTNNVPPLPIATMNNVEYSNPSEMTMIPIWTNTPQGPCWYWGYPSHMTQPYYPEPQWYNITPRVDYHKKKKLVPPQAIYGKNYHKQRKHPKKRIHVPTKTETDVGPNAETEDNKQYIKEDGEV